MDLAACNCTAAVVVVAAALSDRSDRYYQPGIVAAAAAVAVGTAEEQVIEEYTPAAEWTGKSEGEQESRLMTRLRISGSEKV